MIWRNKLTKQYSSDICVFVRWKGRHRDYMSTADVLLPITLDSLVVYCTLKMRNLNIELAT